MATDPSPAIPEPAGTAADPFGALRPRLFGLAYRLLGIRADAEDVLQEAWLRWHRARPEALQSAEAWLVTVVTRLAIDRLRERQAERDAYVGWWLPEPLVEPVDEHTPEAAAERAGELSIALMWVLQRLAPEERAAFLLREVFEQEYADIAALLDKTEAACRQMVHRAAQRVQQERPRFDVPAARHREVLERFVQAARSGEVTALRALLADDVAVVGDGGGKVPAFGHVLRGAERVARLYWATFLQAGDALDYRLVRINGELGLLRYLHGRLESAQAVVTDGARVVAIYAVRNPDKLAHVEHVALDR
jgi:RNA polymerase sigma-70 factor (ECF subfamily)